MSTLTDRDFRTVGPRVGSPPFGELRFVPWPLPKNWLSTSAKIRDVNDPATWGTTGGFVSNERFATHGERVIKRSNRATSRKWYDLGRK